MGDRELVREVGRGGGKTGCQQPWAAPVFEDQTANLELRFCAVGASGNAREAVTRLSRCSPVPASVEVRHVGHEQARE